MGAFVNWARPWVLRAGKRKPFLPIFLFCYRVQLAFVVFCFSRTPYIVAVFLRRQAVLKDAAPGESDYDLTCVTESLTGASIQSWGRLHRVLKKLCPVLGETKLIHYQDFKSHLLAEGPSYGVSRLKELFRRSGWDFSFDVPVQIDFVLFRIISILRDCIWMEVSVADLSLARGQRVRSTRLRKNLDKLEWLKAVAQSKIRSELTYNRDNHDQMLMECERRRTVLESTRRLSVLAASVAGEAMTLKVYRGKRRVSPHWERLAECLPRVFDSSVFSAVSVSCFRLYHFNHNLLVRFRSDLNDDGMDYAWQCLRKVNEALQRGPTPLSPNYGVPLRPCDWEFLREADPLTMLFHDLDHFDILSNRWKTSGEDHVLIRKSAVEQCITEALSMIGSIARREDTNYLFDLLFGQLIAFRLALEEKKLYTAFEVLRTAYLDGLGLTPMQEELVAIYGEGDRQRLDNIPTMRAWLALSDLITYEMDQARKWLSDSDNPSQRKVK